MHAAVLQALEFTRIVDVLRGCAATPLGAERLANLKPATDPRKVAQQLAATSEGVRFNELVGGLALSAPADLAAILGNLAVEGRPLEALRLLALADYLDSVDQARGAIRRTEHPFPVLKALAEGVASFRSEIADTRHKIEPSGEVADGASPDLKAIRERLRRQRTRLRGTLESFLRNRDTAKYLQDQVVTDRNGRFVLVVRAEHRTAIPGIVHGSSSSGASLYLEPLSTVEINNDIVALEQQEAEEVRRVLLGLTDQYRRRALDLQRTIESATDLDVIQAKARLSALVGGAEPALSTDGAFELLAARHPLLIPAVADRLAARPSAAGEGGAGPDAAPPAAPRVEGPVPVDIKLVPGTSVLVVTGPNTGGKTVALKTAGLLALMAQAGLHVPAHTGSRVPVFRSVFADIGDEQSIAANLSTFSWHVANMVQTDRSLALPALVLLDEPGAGTDPIEGGALGLAVVEHFRARGAHVVATTHHEPLKSYASTTPGVVCAAFGFDPESFAPTYRLQYGTPGRSLALEIAGRLGLNPSILESARSNVSAREAQLAEHLAKIDADIRALDHERRLVARERESMAEADMRLKAREQAVRDREERVRQRADEEIATRVRAAREDIDQVVEGLRREIDRLTAEAGRRALHGRPLSTGEAGTARSQARAALDQVEARLGDGREAAPPPAQPQGPAARVGDRVALRGLGVEGRVLSIQAGDAEIDVRGKRLRARLAELRVIGGPAPSEPPHVRVNVQVAPRDAPQTEINVIGCSVDEAIGRIERFLDDLLLTDERQIRIIHGFGTGQLRRSIAEYLERHPLVAAHRPAPPEHGGGGATIAELKD
ncbi:MAG TPA: endonuclease MutS2 [Vicinamibacterales bacterium]|nr:endonuclease MutS2 [Vicinamibacterales bacterium]